MPTAQKIARAIFLIVVLGAVLWLLNWMIGQLPLPAPFGPVAHGIIVVGGVFALIGIILDLAGVSLVKG